MKRMLQPITCKLCGETHPSNGIHTHLKYKHGGMTTEQYRDRFGDFRINTSKAELLKVGKPLYKCLLCGDDKTYTTTALSFHLMKCHHTDKQSYILNTLLGGIPPTCKCGCGQLTKINSYDAPYAAEYVSGHNKSTLGYTFSAESTEKMRDAALSRLSKMKDAGIVPAWHNSESVLKRSKILHDKSIRSKEKKYDVTVLSEQFNKIDFSCNKCGSVYSQFHASYFTCLKCNPPKKSKVQLDLYDYIRNDLGIADALLDHRKTFSGNMEIDIFIPSKMIGIEFDGLYYHSENAGGKSREYHVWKTNECQSKGIRLVHVFEDEWRDKKDIIKSKLSKILGVASSVERLYARKCTVRQIDWASASTFLDKHHIQGSVPSAVILGLFDKDVLVSVATFGKPNAVRGKKSLGDGEWELVRMATDITKTVIGGAGKLLSFFIKEYNPKKVISYADRRFTVSDHNVYNSLGFSLVSNGRPNYYYTNDYKNRLHRYNFTKATLVQSGGDPTKTEWEIMQARGYDRIWDCGHLKYQLDL